MKFGIQGSRVRARKASVSTIRRLQSRVSYDIRLRTVSSLRLSVLGPQPQTLNPKDLLSYFGGKKTANSKGALRLERPGFGGPWDLGV